MSDHHETLPTPSTPRYWQIVDSHTKAVVAECATRKGASRSADRRDNAYGAYRYVVRPVYSSL